MKRVASVQGVLMVLLVSLAAASCTATKVSAESERSPADTQAAPAEPARSPVVAEATIVVSRPVDAVFKAVVPIDLPVIFKGHWPLPAVVSTQDQSGPWNSPGVTRTVVLSDDTTAREELLEVSSPHHFSYRVDRFSGVLGNLVDHAVGQWWFEPLPAADGQPSRTAIRWQYAFVPRSGWSALAMETVVLLFWTPYMNEALEAARAHVEGATQPTQMAWFGAQHWTDR